jgi:MerR family transcriptional regulator, mercuric resistance operon regulatory protein
MDKRITIGDLAREQGVKVETIRYYEQQGLMPQPPRTGSGWRSYRPEDLGTLKFIRQTREMGFSVQDTKRLLSLRENAACEDVAAIASKHLDALRAKMRRLAELELTLSDAIKRCPGGTADHCTILKILDR